MTRPALALLLIFWPLTAVAEVLDGPAFDAYTQGKTVQFYSQGLPYGAEQYLPDAQVIWKPEGGECLYGRWYQGEASQICFVYEDSPEPSCWTFALGPRGMMADLANGAEGSRLILEEQSASSAPLICPGPDIGV